jgi:hypothetical protein
MVSADDYSSGKIEDAARNWACALQSSGEHTTQRPVSSLMSNNDSGLAGG